MKEAKKRIKEFATEYTVQNAVKKGDGATKLSMIIMGAGNLARKEFIKGILFLLSEISFIMMMVLFGLNALASLPSLGTEEQAELFDETTQTSIYTDGDNSMLVLLV